MDPALFFLTVLSTAALAIPPPLPGSRSFTGMEHPRPGQVAARSEGSILTPKLFVITMFKSERDVWLKSDYNLYAQNISVPGLSPVFPHAHCDAAGDICMLTTGEAEINAAATMSALVFSRLFDLGKTYFFITGIAGINPHFGTIGSVTFARYAVQVALENEYDARDIPKNWTTGYIAFGTNQPNQFPPKYYGTEVFELNAALRDRAFTLASKAKLKDSDFVKSNRSFYNFAPANQLPKVVKCDTATSDVYFHGARLAQNFENYVRIITNGTAHYCTTQQEDNASLEALLRAAALGYVDFGRVILMRSASNFDRQPTGKNAVEWTQGHTTHPGHVLSAANLLVAGKPVVDDIVKNWEKVYLPGIKNTNYMGDVMNTLKVIIKADFGIQANVESNG